MTAKKALKSEMETGLDVGIGVTNPGEKLEVAGTVKAYDMNITMDNWADYVFEKDYKLMNLTELESYIKTNKHLPGVPDEKELKKSGLSVAKIQTKHMEKIEESVLYILQLKKENESLKNELNSIKTELSEIKKMLSQNQKDTSETVVTKSGKKTWFSLGK